MRDPDSGRWRIPPRIQTPQDQRLYFALAAQADVILCSVRHTIAMLRDDSLLPFPFLASVEDSDLKQWRLQHGRSESPALAVASTRLKFNGAELKEKLGCPVMAITGNGPERRRVKDLEATGVPVRVFDEGLMVAGRDIRRALTDWGFELLYSVAGPGVMTALMGDHMLDRLYLSQVDVLAGGEEVQTLYGGKAPPRDTEFQLASLYRYQGEEAPGQSFAAYDLVSSGAAQSGR